MKYLLVINAEDWPEKVNLCIFNEKPEKAEQKQVIQEYWKQYERAIPFEEFFDKLIQDGKKKIVRPVRLGIWVEEVPMWPI